MGFIERIKSIAQNGVQKNKITNDKNYLSSYTSNSLKRKNLAQDVFQPSTEVKNEGRLPKEFQSCKGQTYSIQAPVIQEFQDYLAINNPQKFIENYVTYDTFKNALDKNPEIERILKDYNLPVQFYPENVLSISKTHLIPTTKTAQMIYKNLGHSDKEKDYLYLTEAALLHDIGKAFIPPEILNKHGFLTPRERKIVELHNRLSYEILKTTNLSPVVWRLALEHHNYDGSVKETPENQALTVADIYCALREDRPYKKPMSDIRAKTIMYDMGTKGRFDTRYISKLQEAHAG